MFMNRVKKMAVPFKQLLEDISVAITNANQIMETHALDNYMVQGYQKEQGAEQTETYSPQNINISIPQNGEKKIPVTALMHNSTMRLEQVDVKLKFHLEEKDGELMASCVNSEAADESLNEMTLQFKNSPTPEGVARINNHYIQSI